MLFILVWFFVDAHKWFKGPKINIEVCHNCMKAHFSPSPVEHNPETLTRAQHHMLHRDLVGVEGVDPTAAADGKQPDIERESGSKTPSV